MKFILLIVFGIFCLSSNLNAQGIEFMHNLDEAFTKAKEEDKMVFIDFYTSWCGPCKKLSKDVFTTKEAGDFFNKNFINCKIQCDDKGIGEELAKKYNIAAYPTLMFLNKNGELVQSMAGAPGVNGLIGVANIALNPERNLLSITRVWDEGNREEEFVRKYFGSLKGARQGHKANKDFIEYFNALSDDNKTSKKIFELIQLVGAAPFSPVFTFIEDNKSEYYITVNKEEIDKFISDGYLWHLKQMAGYAPKEEYEAAMLKFKAKQYSYYNEYAMFYSIFSLQESTGKIDVEEYQKIGTKFLDKYGENNDAYTISLSSLLGNLTSGHNKGAAGIKWMENLLERNRDPRYLQTYFYILWRNCQFDKSIVIGKEMRANAVKNGKSTESIDKQIEDVLSYQARVENNNTPKKK